MSRNGSGVYTPPGADFPAVGGTLIESTKFNNVINDIATGLTTSLASDGQTTPTANLPMGGFKLTGLGNGTASTDAAAYGQLDRSQVKNAVINGGMLVAQRATLTLGSSAPAANAGYAKVDRFQAWATGTAVSAGTATQDTAAGIGRTGYALKLAGVTLTGTGIVYVRHRIEAKNSLRFKNRTASLSCVVKHDVGSAINYTLTVRKANTADTFSAVTSIQAGSATSVSSATETTLTLAGISMGDCTTGIEIEIKAECGAITTKNFWVTEVQLEDNATATVFEHVGFDQSLERCMRYFEKTHPYATEPADNTNTWTTYPAYALSTSSWYMNIWYKIPKRTATTTVTGTYYTTGNNGKWLLTYGGSSTTVATLGMQKQSETHYSLAGSCAAVLTAGACVMLQGDWYASDEL